MNATIFITTKLNLTSNTSMSKVCNILILPLLSQKHMHSIYALTQFDVAASL